MVRGRQVPTPLSWSYRNAQHDASAASALKSALRLQVTRDCYASLAVVSSSRRSRKADRPLSPTSRVRDRHEAEVGNVESAVDGRREASTLSGLRTPNSRTRDLAAATGSLMGRSKSTRRAGTAGKTYAITFVARPSSGAGTLYPIELATFALTIRSKFFGSSTGRSEGLAPRSTWST